MTLLELVHETVKCEHKDDSQTQPNQQQSQQQQPDQTDSGAPAVTSEPSRTSTMQKKVRLCLAHLLSIEQTV